MEQSSEYKNRRGGRPKKDLKKDQVLTIKCTAAERNVISEKAKVINVSVSEYLREIGVNGKIVSKQKSFPAEILRLTGTLNHLAANLNQIAKKRNGVEPLDAFERAGLELQSRELKQLVQAIKNYLE